MFFGIFILTRLLFIGVIIMIMGYVFGRFSQNKTLTTLTKIAAVLLIVLFAGSNMFFFGSRARARANWNGNHPCNSWQTDSVHKR